MYFSCSRLRRFSRLRQFFAASVSSEMARAGNAGHNRLEEQDQRDFSAAILSACGAQIAHNIRTGGGKPLSKLSAGLEGMEKVDLKAVVKNYEIIYQLADFCECRIPTKKALENGIAKADKDQQFKISGYTQAQARAAYVAYEASKLHMMLSHINNHFGKKKLRNALPQELKIGMLKDLWKRHRPAWFESDHADTMSVASSEGIAATPPLPGCDDDYSMRDIDDYYDELSGDEGDAAGYPGTPPTKPDVAEVVGVVSSAEEEEHDESQMASAQYMKTFA